MDPLVHSQLDILRRICDRGIMYGLKIDESRVVDLFQHMQDELERLKLYCENTNERS